MQIVPGQLSETDRRIHGADYAGCTASVFLGTIAKPTTPRSARCRIADPSLMSYSLSVTPKVNHRGFGWMPPQVPLPARESEMKSAAHL
jgi:hypothetical protein